MVPCVKAARSLHNELPGPLETFPGIGVITSDVGYIGNRYQQLTSGHSRRDDIGIGRSGASNFRYLGSGLAWASGDHRCTLATLFATFRRGAMRTNTGNTMLRNIVNQGDGKLELLYSTVWFMSAYFKDMGLMFYSCS